MTVNMRKEPSCTLLTTWKIVKVVRPLRVPLVNRDLLRLFFPHLVSGHTNEVEHDTDDDCGEMDSSGIM